MVPKPTVTLEAMNLNPGQISENPVEVQIKLAKSFRDMTRPGLLFTSFNRKVVPRRYSSSGKGWRIQVASSSQDGCELFEDFAAKELRAETCLGLRLQELSALACRVLGVGD